MSIEDTRDGAVDAADPSPEPADPPVANRRRQRHKRRTQQAGGVQPWWLLLALPMLLAVWAGYNQLRLGVALKLLDADVRLLERDPALATDTARLTELGRAAERMQTIAGAHVEAQELIARSHWLQARAAGDPVTQIRHLRLARDALHLALSRRSSWPYTWALLARIEFHLAPRGDAARIALTQALDLGMRGYRLQQQLLELRLLSEGRIDPALQERIRQSFLGGLREHGSQLAERALTLGRADWVCGDPDARELQTDWCARMAQLRRRSP